MKEKFELSQDDFETLCICAIRYCHGRRTYMPTLVRDIVRPFIPGMSDIGLHVMLKDCEHQREFSMYGDPTIDKPAWIEWENLLKREKERRDGKGKKKER